MVCAPRHRSEPRSCIACHSSCARCPRGEQHPPLSNPGQYLQERSLLLLLDNFEQVVEAAPQLANLVMRAPGVQVLVTSRMPLGLYGEHEYPVLPMQVPGTEWKKLSAHSGLSDDPDKEQTPGNKELGTIAEYDAVQLFLARARDLNPHFALTRANAEAVVDICRRLDGLPLALELAASRLRLFPPKALLKGLEHSLTLLTGGSQDLPPRQRTLQGSIEWSYDLLDPAEQELFALLSVFVGGCTLSAIEQVVSTLGMNAEDKSLLDKVESLVSKTSCEAGSETILRTKRPRT